MKIEEIVEPERLNAGWTKKVIVEKKDSIFIDIRIGNSRNEGELTTLTTHRLNRDEFEKLLYDFFPFGIFKEGNRYDVEVER